MSFNSITIKNENKLKPKLSRARKKRTNTNKHNFFDFFLVGHTGNCFFIETQAKTFLKKDLLITFFPELFFCYLHLKFLLQGPRALILKLFCLQNE